MPTPNPHMPAAAEPRFGALFDTWNSSSTGHQKAENRLGGSIGWRQSRSMKLSHQFKSGGSGGVNHVSDLVGAGSENCDEKAKAIITSEVRQHARISIEDMLIGKVKVPIGEEEQLMAKRKAENKHKEHQKLNRQKGIFDGLVIYVNGSTHPLISDHKLKHVLAENGGRVSLHVGRKQVTHVILGKPSGAHSGSGGGLAGEKMEREIRKVGGKGLKYVGVEWVIESLKVGKRLREAQFSNLKVAAKGQQSIYGMFKTGNADSVDL